MVEGQAAHAAMPWSGHVVAGKRVINKLHAGASTQFPAGLFSAMIFHSTGIPLDCLDGLD